MFSVRVLVIATAALSLACRQEAPSPRAFDGAAAFGYLETQLAFGPRIPGTEGHEAMAGWLDSLLAGRADTLVRQRWVHVTAAGDSLPLTNFLLRYNPDAQAHLLFLAHWDTRPHADGPQAGDNDGPVPGANDGASGVAVLLGMADALHRYPPAADVGIDLLLVDGEDYGIFSEQVDVLIGTRYFVEHRPPGVRYRYAILFDMIGDKDLRIPQEGNSLIGAPDVVEAVWDAAKDLGYSHIFVPTPGQTVDDDHVPLQQAGIPAIDLIDFEYPAWHTVDDTIDKVSAESLQAVGAVALEMIHRAER